MASSRCAVERAMPSSAATAETRTWPESRSACRMRSALSTDSIAYGGLFFTAESYGWNTLSFGILLMLTLPVLVLEEVAQGGGGLCRAFLGEEVAAGQGAGAHVVGVLAPDRRDVAVVLAHEAVLAPQGEQRGGDPLAAGGGGVIVVQVGADGGAVVLARGVDGGRVPEAAHVLVHGAGVDRLAAAAQAADAAVHPADRVGADLVLGERLRLGEEEPVPVAEAELHVGGAQGVPGGDDVEHGYL